MASHPSGSARLVVSGKVAQYALSWTVAILSSRSHAALLGLGVDVSSSAFLLACSSLILSSSSWLGFISSLPFFLDLSFFFISALAASEILSVMTGACLHELCNLTFVPVSPAASFFLSFVACFGTVERRIYSVYRALVPDGIAAASIS